MGATQQQKEAVKLLISSLHDEYKKVANDPHVNSNTYTLLGYDAAIWDMCVYALDLFEIPTSETYKNKTT